MTAEELTPRETEDLYAVLLYARNRIVTEYGKTRSGKQWYKDRLAVVDKHMAILFEQIEKIKDSDNG